MAKTSVCDSQKSNSKDYSDNFDRIFGHIHYKNCYGKITVKKEDLPEIVKDHFYPGEAEFIKVQPSSSAWYGSFLKIYTENENGNGKTLVCYGDNSWIVLSGIVGILKNTEPVIREDRVEWESSRGTMVTDGRVIEKKKIAVREAENV